jgi:aspartyl-tRNA(Asn)/glutamyl-tRNA(Gln) amidotransferase subunit A
VAFHDPIWVGLVGAVAAVTTALELAHEWQPSLNCFVTIDDESALKRARQVEAGGTSGPLAGLPFAYKDVFVRRLREQPRAGTDEDFLGCDGPPADVDDILHDAGAIDIGALHLDELAYGATGRNEVLGDCHNPWDLRRASGGSSSGAAAVVAARVLPLAIGTDTGGSVRVPAAWCGVLGLKPTYSAISTRGVVPLAPSHDTVALVALQAGLLGAAYRTLCGRPRAVKIDVTNLTVGHLSGAPLGGVDESVAEGMAIGARALAALGAQVRDLRWPDLDDCNVAAAVVTATEAAAIHGPLWRDQAQHCQGGTRTRLRAGSLLAGVDYVDALRFRGDAIADALAGPFSEVDVVMTPVAPTVAPELATVPSPNTPALATGTGALLAFTRPFNFLGFPCLSIPVGLSPEGLPLAVQLIARPWQEETLLAAADAMQGLIGWDRWPLPTPAHPPRTTTAED